ncbi:hypothetical protein VCHA53O466_140004 [Vibrio chagasii]|nr:hypothetical protein VCHA53O466_140004 [Vibrio chagasii]
MMRSIKQQKITSNIAIKHLTTYAILLEWSHQLRDGLLAENIKGLKCTTQQLIRTSKALMVSTHFRWAQ